MNPSCNFVIENVLQHGRFAQAIFCPLAVKIQNKSYFLKIRKIIPPKNVALHFKEMKGIVYFFTLVF